MLGLLDPFMGFWAPVGTVEIDVNFFIFMLPYNPTVENHTYYLGKGARYD